MAYVLLIYHFLKPISGSRDEEHHYTLNGKYILLEQRTRTGTS